MSDRQPRPSDTVTTPDRTNGRTRIVTPRRVALAAVMGVVAAFAFIAIQRSRAIRIFLRARDLNETPQLLDDWLFGTDDIDRAAAERYVRSAEGQKTLLRLAVTLLLDRPKGRSPQWALPRPLGEIFFVVIDETYIQAFVTTHPSRDRPLVSTGNVASDLRYQRLERALTLLSPGVKDRSRIAAWDVQCASRPAADLFDLLDGDWKARFGDPWGDLPALELTKSEFARASRAGSPAVGIYVVLEGE